MMRGQKNIKQCTALFISVSIVQKSTFTWFISFISDNCTYPLTHLYQKDERTLPSKH